MTAAAKLRALHPLRCQHDCALCEAAEELERQARDIHTLENQRDDLYTQVSRLEKDAGRYRWLRAADPMQRGVEPELLPTLDLTALDDGIDAAMSAVQPGEDHA